MFQNSVAVPFYISPSKFNFICISVQYIRAKPDQVEVMKGLFMPGCSDCDSKAVLQVRGQYME